MFVQMCGGGVSVVVSLSLPYPRPRQARPPCMHGGGRDQWGAGEGDWDI
jgi:hypothetical protein